MTTVGGAGISLMLLALSCIGAWVTLPGDVEKEGRWLWETELSARDLSCSDQLKPLPSPGRAETGKSDAVLGFDCVLACDCVLGGVTTPVFELERALRGPDGMVGRGAVV